MNVPPGTNKTVDIPKSPDYYKGAVFNPVNNQTIVQGANPVIDIQFHIVGTGTVSIVSNPVVTPPISPKGVKGQMTMPIPTTTIGRIISVQKTRFAYPIAKGQMTRYPTFGTVGGIVNDNISDPADPYRLYFVTGGDMKNVQTIIGNPLQNTNQGTNIINGNLWADACNFVGRMVLKSNQTTTYNCNS